jgi:hypothetical protein
MAGFTEEDPRVEQLESDVSLFTPYDGSVEVLASSTMY